MPRRPDGQQRHGRVREAHAEPAFGRQLQGAHDKVPEAIAQPARLAVGPSVGAYIALRRCQRIERARTTNNPRTG